MKFRNTAKKFGVTVAATVPAFGVFAACPST